MNIRFIYVVFFFVTTSVNAQVNFGFPDNFNPEYYQFPDFTEGVDCKEKTILFKLKPEHRNVLNVGERNGLKRYIEFLNPVSLKRKFPLHSKPLTEYNTLGQPLTDLSLIYEFSYSKEIPVQKVFNEFIASGMVLYAQPLFYDQPLNDNPLKIQWTPNDTNISLQWYLTKIRAIDAWDIDTGSDNVIIAIVDGGTNFTHPDLLDNIYYNLSDTIDGIDNDGDGYIDNYTGWDVGDNDNYPQYIGTYNSAHGTAMCGLAAASSNNITSMAGVSYKCKYMPVKMVQTGVGWVAGYDGIVYAADHGADVISCSWGGTIPQPYAQDVVNYAIINKGIQIVAAAGNSNNTVPFFPASYEGVIAVGGTNLSDEKSANSSFYEFVDMVSPGQSIYETYATGYTYGNGTSDATAITSGGFGILKSFFSGFNSIQTGALLVQSSYRVDTIPVNSAYQNKMGSGRMDLYNALTSPGKPYIYFYNRTYKDGFDDILLVNDTVSLSGNFINFLDTSSTSLSATLSTSSPYIQIIDSISVLSILQTLQFHANFSDVFRFVILPGCPSNHPILFKLVFEDNGFLNTQYFTIHVNQQFYNVNMNGLSTTITNTGKIGFFDNLSTIGLGYRMNGGDNQLLGTYFNPMGFWIGDNGQVSNQTLGSVLGPCCPYLNDAHFSQISPIQRIAVPEVSDLEIISHYNDDGAGASKLNVEIIQKTYAWNTTSSDSNFIILEYQIINNDTIGKNDVFAGIFSDFDMPDTLYDLSNNKAYYDTLNTMGVLYNTGGKVFSGIRLVSDLPVSYYAFNSGGSGGSYTLYDGFSQAEKWGAMSNGILIPESGITDIAQFIGARIDTIAPGGCANLVFALLIAQDSIGLITVSNSALNKYHQIYNIWTGNGGDSNWHNALNWSQNSVPDFTDYVVIPDTRTTQKPSPVISNANGNVKDIQIRCGGELLVTNGMKLLVGN